MGSHDSGAGQLRRYDLFLLVVRTPDPVAFDRDHGGSADLRKKD